MRCITPISVYNNKKGRREEVPCGRCWPCLQRRADAWAFRILQEEKRETTVSAYFVTLTYNNKHIPVNPETMRLTLDRKEIPRYMKRLRKLQDKAYKLKKQKSPQIKYYAVGEYGEDYTRPHYHIIIFNALKELIPLAWNKGNELLGMVHIGNKGVTAGGARYVAQYMLTGQDVDYTDREKPFSLMSKHLGENYLTDAMKKWHLTPTGKSVVTEKGIIKTRDRYYAISDGFKIALPRYYRDKIFPKIYREIDIPTIAWEMREKELDEIYKDPEGYSVNLQGLRETHESIKIRKAKLKQRIEKTPPAG